ncbi:GNAT family N-acetyltransferase [Actinomadura sp. NEAU-AAG7]|uniref:GNAT family N-acetyltransferase n=1 Tax=Actinomadura sp. NEAU-AAG7 TaxID=2839640 RepID=UPI001BE3FB18|nr:GNAT family N-acetyltransferase [Actinomadura sp. NEAU-AAG7]MBT2211190.1 GNAT family N-acetyltransferase [Actinomadura sp. NEAU-AAG7]
MDLETERLVLHPLTIAEAEGLTEGRPSGAGWAPGYPTDSDLAGARRYLATCVHAGDPQPFGAYEIRRREDGLAIGGLGFHGAADERGAVTIGYGLIPSAQGKGYATEALRGLLRFARDSGVTAVEGDTDLGNVASQRVMAAVGMEFVGADDRLMYYRITWENRLRAPHTVEA